MQGVSAELYLMVRAGVHPKAGLAVTDSEEAALKRMRLRRAADGYVLASLEKIGTVAWYTVAGLSDVAGIVADAPADHAAVQEFRRQGVTVIPAQKESSPPTRG